MEGPILIIAAAIGSLLVFPIILFVWSIFANWNTAYKIFLGITVVLMSHVLLFYLVIFSENITMPAILTKYTIGIFNFLTKLFSI